MCTGDTFKASELNNCREKRATLKKDKALLVTAEEVEKDALVILETKVGDIQAGDDNKRFTGLQFRTLLAFYGVEKKRQGKSVVNK